MVCQHLHEIGLQQAFTCLNVMTAHKAKVVGLGPVQCWRVNPECVATFCMIISLLVGDLQLQAMAA